MADRAFSITKMAIQALSLTKMAAKARSFTKVGFPDACVKSPSGHAEDNDFPTTAKNFISWQTSMNCSEDSLPGGEYLLVVCRVELQSECVMDIEQLVHTAESLENIMVRCFGPHGRQVLFVRATGDILITKDGCRILKSLLLEHPAARLVVRSVSAHCSLTGDGAKSFILLLAAMLRGSRAEIGGEVPACPGARRLWLARGLARLEQEVLEMALGRYLAPHCASALRLSGRQLQLPGEQAARVLGPYFEGKVGSSHASFLTQLACDFLQRLGDGETEPALSLAADCFPGLQSTVPGLPVGSSRVLEGLLLNRSFSLSCGEGETRVLVVAGSLLPPLTEAGYTLRLETPAGLARARDWAQTRAVEALAHLRALGVGLLLSGPRQPACVLELARRHGISVVDCLPDDDLALVRRLAGAHPLFRAVEAQLGDTVPASFSRPAPLGPPGQVLVGFPGCRGLQPHCLVVCAPALGLAEQHRDAIHGAFKLLRSSCPGLGERWGMKDQGKAEDQTEDVMDTGGEDEQHCQSIDQPGQRVPWELGHYEVPAGSVLAPDGAFEFLMHHYLRCEASSQQQPDTRAACRIVADALLNVPRHLHPRAERGRDFLQAHARFAASLREQGVPPVVEGPLDVVAAKQRLLISVIRCLRSLLTVNQVIAVRSKLGNKLQAESEESE
ncbi:LOW QUALITY PROTEIN: Bardet-Biedl syndrome 10 protein [Carcharodon carcharias]|uniref:LOW QUALITY PROTEIN: Bardet-Biedl syndrome 10 protein n=1 Tax=Carcharodon carcharias TaxID=13397 RepID=UPI001B7E3692|nr:LOW QUALITY PROTEIN: Bardet-Biedl syndrome 10 protein [Carcharodon carcharias]